MKHPRRLVYLVVLLVLWAALGALPGRAQQTEGGRFAFADTTLLRDTLGLTFERLFPLADSLGTTPDTLRALAIRYRFPIDRIVRLADSLHVPVDSVGARLERERFNVLAVHAQRINALRYSSTYNIQRTSSTWSNGSDYNFVRGPVLIHNLTDINIDRYTSTAGTSLRQTRTSTTETGWKLTPNFSIGGRANLERFDSADPGDIATQGESKNEFQFSVRTRQQPRKGFESNINFFSGVLDLSNFQLVKRGASGDLNGTVRFEVGRWLTHDLSGQVTGNLARTGLPGVLERANTHDLSNNLRGTLGMFTNTPVGVNVNYTLRRTVVETPVASPESVSTGTGTTVVTHARVQQVRSINNGLDATMRLRQATDRYVNLGLHATTTEQASAAQLTLANHRDELSGSADGRLAWRLFNLEGHFSNGLSVSKYPSRAFRDTVIMDPTGTDSTKIRRAVGYGESLRTASVDGTLSRPMGTKLVMRATGRVSLSQSRYFLIGSYPNPPVNHDLYQQNYRFETLYTVSDAFNSSLALDVSRNETLNLPKGTTSSNNETHNYRAEWRWTYRLLKGLTATQRNALSANYLFYHVLTGSNRLQLDYSVITTLNAVLSPRLTIDVTHNSHFQPSGNYGAQPDGVVYFSRSDEQRDYTLQAHIAYSPGGGVSLLLDPEYLANNRASAQNGVLQPQTRGRSLNFSGGASLNLGLGPKGRVTGQILRTFRDDESSTFGTDGTLLTSPRTEQDFWNGSLSLTWEL